MGSGRLWTIGRAVHRDNVGAFSCHGALGLAGMPYAASLPFPLVPAPFNNFKVVPMEIVISDPYHWTRKLRIASLFVERGLGRRFGSTRPYYAGVGVATGSSLGRVLWRVHLLQLSAMGVSSKRHGYAGLVPGLPVAGVGGPDGGAGSTMAQWH